MFTETFGFTPGQERLRARVRELLNGVTVRRELADVRRGRPWRHPEHTYRALGERGWLAVDWPTRYGGLGATIAESAIVAEEMALAGVPDSARINTIDNAGFTLLSAGTPEQRAAHLPSMAAGEQMCCVLYSEPGAGSDLGNLSTRAERDGTGWRLEGEKIWNIGAPAADFGVCAARTGTGASRYADISLFMVPLHTDRVRISEVPGLNPEAFNRITFDGTSLSADALVGALGGGWQLITEALALERTGVYFYGRARRWLDLLGLFDIPAHLEDEAARLRAELPMARLLTWKCVDRLARRQEAGAAAAAAKWWTSELAHRVARLAWRMRDRIGAGAPGDWGVPSADAELAAAMDEAPGLTLSGGTSEIMLATVGSGLLDEGTEAA